MTNCLVMAETTRSTVPMVMTPWKAVRAMTGWKAMAATTFCAVVMATTRYSVTVTTSTQLSSVVVMMFWKVVLETIRCLGAMAMTV